MAVSTRHVDPGRFTVISLRKKERKKGAFTTTLLKFLPPTHKTGELLCRLHIETHYLLQRNYITAAVSSETKTGICHSAAVP